MMRRRGGMCLASVRSHAHVEAYMTEGTGWAAMATILKRLAAARRHSDAVTPSDEEGVLASASEARRSKDVMDVFQQYKNAPLGTLLRHLIAAQDGIRPEEVTIDYIQGKREELFYPTTRYNVDSQYGGYDSRRLKFLTRNEFDSIAKQVEEELARLTERSGGDE